MRDVEPDWALWRSFAAVVENGSLSAAARAIGLSQPTLGRHIEALEQVLEVTLFERSLSGLRPTETALKLYEPVREAEAALARAGLIAEGATEALEGSVRITASTMMAHHVLPPILAAIRGDHPGIALELVASDTADNLLLREADIAVRMFRPTQLDLISRHLGDIPIIACAHRNYLDRHGKPQSMADLGRHALIGYDRSDAITLAAKALGFDLRRADFVVRTDSQTAMWELIKAGLGIGFAQAGLVAVTPGLVPLFASAPVASMEVWLTTHRELYTSRRIRAIYDALGRGLDSTINKGPAAAGTRQPGRATEV
ncbi:MAG: LysR family transcriptional regulator [Devosia sp.]